jgi:hypothetical protein
LKNWTLLGGWGMLDDAPILGGPPGGPILGGAAYPGAPPGGPILGGAAYPGAPFYDLGK